MYINQSYKIDEAKGEFCILNDYGSQGLSVYGQYESIEEAIRNLGANYGQILVRLVNFSVKLNGEITQ
mgnify:CR=1 FL=1